MEDFEELLGREMPVLERFVKYRIGNRQDADDILQEVCMAAFQSFEGLKQKSKFKAWLLGIARHKCNDYFREKAKFLQISIDDLKESVFTHGAHGTTVSSVVRETLELLGDKEKQILYLYYLKELPQDQIAARLGLPIGTVKSRLHYAKQSFKEKYPYKPNLKGEKAMKEKIMKEFPEYMPDYTIEAQSKTPFAVIHRELPGMFIIPAENEAVSFVMYDFPGRKRSARYDLKVTGKVNIHGMEGVEIRSCCQEEKRKEENVIFAQLTDTHCRYLGGENVADGCRKIITFLDEEFESAYGIGEGNCGFPVERRSEGRMIQKEHELIYEGHDDISDLVGSFTVTLAGKEYDTVRLIDAEESEGGVMLCEYYLDHAGRTVLWRRFNSNHWALERYGKSWTEMLPDNERLTVNGEPFVHWYDCITGYGNL